jgi:hypothetical protein
MLDKSRDFSKKEQNVPVNLMGHLRAQRKYISADIVATYAEETFDRNHAPITVNDLHVKFNVSPKHARRIVKRLRTKSELQKGVLFTPQNLKPQKYYPESRHADVIEYFRKKNIPLNVTGTRHSWIDTRTDNQLIHPPSVIEKRKADSLLEALIMTHTLPRQIHNIQLETSVGKQYYFDIDARIETHTKLKKIEHRIDGNMVTYRYYPCGTAITSITCTKNPFNIETIEDEYIIHSYLGQIRGKMLEHLADSRGCIVPLIPNWLLLECDVNIDVPVTDGMQLTFPAVQIYPKKYVMQTRTNLSCSLFFKVLRMYIKSIEDKAFLRFEGLMNSRHPVFEVLQSLRYPREYLAGRKVI